MMRITPAVKHLLILNVIIFVGTAFLGNKYFFDGILALYYPMSGAFEFWQIGTHMFMHGNLTHGRRETLGRASPVLEATSRCRIGDSSSPRPSKARA